ncbi:MAG: uncharacterized protein QG635_1934 [Bacteroidota bacterium]|nr:uncharacterized protein [Bacteroidota bacterium]
MEIIAGFMMGILGSFHCLGMCGPLVLAIPSRNQSRISIAIDSLLYNLGRTATYTIMGALAGLIGASLSLAVYQKNVSIIAGVMLLLLALIPKKWESMLSEIIIIRDINNGLKKIFGRIIGRKTIASYPLIGLLNGLLPCGLVYMALTASIASGTVAGASAFMLFFGLGTIPMMASLFIVKNMFTPGIRRKINRLIPFGVAIVAVILILRGMGLGIKYVSPALPEHIKGKPACCTHE